MSPSVQRQLEEILAIPAEEAIQASAKDGHWHRGNSGSDRARGFRRRNRRQTRRCARWCLIRCLTFIAAWSATCVSSREQWKRITAIMLMSNNARYEIKEVGVFTPKMLLQEQLNAGDVGYFIANIKTTAEIKIGDTHHRPAPSRARAAARFSGNSSDGVQRDLSD